ncbi:MAG: hypothetical protein HQL80_08780, partial [Magnetococcales bacterium]|nr:hypothetical protein [Magnetococcales bacterium]
NVLECFSANTEWWLPEVENAPLLRPVAVCAGVSANTEWWLGTRRFCGLSRCVTNALEWFLPTRSGGWVRRGGGLSAGLGVFSRTEWWPGWKRWPPTER